MAKKTVAIIGIGRVGLPMALVLADEGFKVYGIGRDPEKIAMIKSGRMPFIEEGASVLLKKYVNEMFFPTVAYEVVQKCEVIILTLGTPIDENMNPVLDQIDAALGTCLPYLKKDQIIILRSTVSPRTTDYVKEKIEMNTQFKVGRDIFLAFCPERIAEGKAIEEIKILPQIIGGADAESGKKAGEFFTSFGVKSLITDSLSAELAKLFTNMYRYISFGIANEFMFIAEDFNRNIHDIVNLVNKDYKRGGLVLPGLSAGPCLFKDGFFLINENPFLDLITASWKINESVPLFLLRKLREKTNLVGKRVALLGLAFKPEIDDIRESLSFKIRKALLREHAQLTLHDPFVKEYSRQKVTSDYKEALKGAEVVIIATRHKQYVDKTAKILSLLSDNCYISDIWHVMGMNELIFTAGDAKRKFNK